jgi:hypothetical protein
MQTSLLAQRLERLRESPTRATRASAPVVDHAGPLAAALGGTAAGPIVVVEDSLPIPVDRDGLSSLPYGVPLDRPLVCLDLETTGLATAAGTLAFLVGLGWWEGDRLTVRQMVLTDHAGESALLDALAAAIPSDAWLVTYNGRCFDWPLIVARYRMHRAGAPALAGHLDLLPISRQLWKHRTGSARLSVIEQHVCDVRRSDDLPGALIPERYFAYLRSRRPELLQAPVDHNRLDVISLARLVARLGTLSSRASWPSVEAGDLFGLARAMARRDRVDEALECLGAGLTPERWRVRGPADVALHREMCAERARLLARVGRRHEAAAAWLDIASRGGSGAALAWLHVARYREHVERDFDAALRACHEAAAVAGRARAWGVPLHAVDRDLQCRLPRLARKSLAFRGDPAVAAVSAAA